MEMSKFNLWRASFSFCFVDGFLDEKELQWINEKLNKLNFTDEQRKTLEKDLISPPDVDSILPKITSPADRGFLVNNLRLLSYLDNFVSDEEKKKIDEVKNIVLSRINLPDLENKVAEESKRVVPDSEIINKHSFSERIIKQLTKL